VRTFGEHLPHLEHEGVEQGRILLHASLDVLRVGILPVVQDPDAGPKVPAARPECPAPREDDGSSGAGYFDVTSSQPPLARITRLAFLGRRFLEPAGTRGARNRAARRA
jgi:hypothetical protein